MKFLPIVWRNLLRRKFRTFFTIGAIFFAFLLFGVLMAIRAAFGMGVEMAGQGRLMVIDKVSIINPLPASYEAQIRQIEGVTDITHANWFGGYYQDVRNQFATFAVDPESWLRVYPKEFELPEEQKKAWIADRTGAIVGADTAKKYGFKVGQRVPIQGTIYRRPDGGPWEFTIDGIYDSKIKGADKTNLLFNYQFLRETIPEQSGFRDRYNWYVFTIAEPGSRAGDRREDRRDVRQLAVGDEDEHREGLRLRLGEAGRRHRHDHDVDRRDGDVHDPARRRQHDGAGDPRANERARRAEDARFRRRPHPEHGAARIDRSSPWSAAGWVWRCRTRSSPRRAIRRTDSCRPSTSRRPRCIVGIGLRASASASRRASCPRGRPAGCGSSTRSGETDAVADHRRHGRQHPLHPARVSARPPSPSSASPASSSSSSPCSRSPKA